MDLDGTGLEDTMLPMAHHMAGRPRPTAGDAIRMFVHDRAIGATTQRSIVVRGLLSFVAWLGRLAGLRAFDRRDEWDAESRISPTAP